MKINTGIVILVLGVFYSITKVEQAKSSLNSNYDSTFKNILRDGYSYKDAYYIANDIINQRSNLINSYMHSQETSVDNILYNYANSKISFTIEDIDSSYL